MKKIVIFLLIAIMIISMVSCNKKDNNIQPTKTTQVQTQEKIKLETYITYDEETKNIIWYKKDIAEYYHIKITRHEVDKYGKIIYKNYENVVDIKTTDTFYDMSKYRSGTYNAVVYPCTSNEKYQSYGQSIIFNISK